MNDRQGEGEVAAVWVGIGDLVPWADNPRINSDAVAAVVESIRRFGFSSPIIARTADSQVIAGHTRLEAARTLGLEKVPVRFLDLDPADAKLLAVADNRLGEVAEWDEEGLAGILKGLYNEGLVLDIGVAGFTEADLEGLFTAQFDLDVEDVPDPFAVPPAADEAVSFTFGEYRGRVDRAVYLHFTAEYEKQKAAGDSPPMLSDVLKGWLGV